jgi:hypothetical protein
MGKCEHDTETSQPIKGDDMLGKLIHSRIQKYELHLGVSWTVISHYIAVPLNHFYTEIALTFEVSLELLSLIN